MERLEKSCIRELVVTDTICHPPDSIGPNVRELSVAGLLGEAVERIHEERSLSSLFV
jgi:ribose-phosphate pyrophosphokinase